MFYFIFKIIPVTAFSKMFIESISVAYNRVRETTVFFVGKFKMSNRLNYILLLNLENTNVGAKN